MHDMKTTVFSLVPDSLSDAKFGAAAKWLRDDGTQWGVMGLGETVEEATRALCAEVYAAGAAGN